eukprot:CAMPEP_0180232992 /NCGR_PEP_ID=MMETSP0987-20121128/27807_2 /TAXON_ID=697907 /ORGANISM="non described non described, Strain CCMP2293" /LENGTH=104 /DNA_ID=CAMNT_0022198719 /DNA_START=159 /DNA_END=470 /DNA_ORIENTATION=-
MKLDHEVDVGAQVPRLAVLWRAQRPLDLLRETQRRASSRAPALAAWVVALLARLVRPVGAPELVEHRPRGRLAEREPHRSFPRMNLDAVRREQRVAPTRPGPFP